MSLILRQVRTDLITGQDVVSILLTTADGVEHLVPDYALAERSDEGEYPACCGKLVRPASMSQPPGELCDLCQCVADVARAHARSRA